jgi:hypothetical protein
MSFTPSDVHRAAIEKQASTTLRALAIENQELREKVASLQEKIASYEHGARVEAIVDQIEARGLMAGKTRSEKIAHVASVDDLDKLASAVGLIDTDGGFKLAELSSIPSGSLNSEEAFFQFCIGA